LRASSPALPHLGPGLARRLALGLALLAAAPALADSPPPILPAERPRTELGPLIHRRKLALLERNLGWSFSAIGVAAAATGVMVLVYALEASIPYQTALSDETAGIATMIAGVVFLVPGLVLSVHGQNALSTADWLLQGAIYAVPLRDGFAAGARFSF
jgi:hypothetical protein